jgi:hypothetical protein
MKAVWRSIFRLGALGFLLSGCGDSSAPELQLPPLRSRTSRVDYHSDTDLSACPDAAARVQARLEVLERVFGVSAPARIAYAHYENVEALSGGFQCPTEATGCQLETSVGSTSFVDFHELVHVTLQPQGSPDALVLEGIAVAYQHAGGAEVVLKTWPTWQKLVSQAGIYPPQSAVYDFGGAFSAYLVTRFGMPQFLAFYRSSTAAASPDLFAAQFQQAFGITLDTAWADANTVEGYSVCEDLSPNTPLNGSEAVTDASCLDAFGPARHVFELSRDTPLALETNYGSASIGACSLTEQPSNWGFVGDFTGSWTVDLGSWRPGRYYVTPSNLTAQDSFSATEGAFQGPACAPLVPYVIGHAVQQMRVQMRPELESWVALSYPGKQPLEFRLATDLNSPNATACDWSSCTSCDESTCTAIAGGKLTVQGTLYLHTKTSDARGERGCMLLAAY